MSGDEPLTLHPDGGKAADATIAELRSSVLALEKRNQEQEKLTETLTQQVENLRKEKESRASLLRKRLDFATPVGSGTLRRDPRGSSFRTPSSRRINPTAPPLLRPLLDAPTTSTVDTETRAEGNPNSEGQNNNSRSDDVVDLSDREEDLTEEELAILREREEAHRAHDGDFQRAIGESQFDELRRKLNQTADEMKRMKSQVHRVTSDAPEIERVLEEAQKTPFTDRVTQTRLSDPGKVKIKPYNGTTDPKAHLTSFRIAMGRARFRKEEEDAGYCLLFVENLKDDALEWFSKLERDSIDNFSQLSKAFLKQYSMYITQETSDADLWSITQGQTESLKKFIDRFKAVVSKIDGVSDRSALEALKRSLWYESCFREEMTLNPPPTIQDALHRASGFIKLEEDIRASERKHRTKPPSKSTPSAPSTSSGRKGSSYVNFETKGGAHNYQVETGPSPGGPPKPQWGAERLLAGELGDISKFLVMETREEPDQQEESTDEQPGQTPEGPPPEAPKRGRRNEEPTGANSRRKVFMIMGGSQYCPDTISALKDYQRQAETAKSWPQPAPCDDFQITFEEEDAAEIQHPHNDPLVVQLVISDVNVARVLIDTGSSVDVILQRMDIDFSEIEPIPKPLTGFTSETTMTLGNIRLPVQAGGVTKVVNFVVADHPAIYNVIMGIPWINSMRAIPSTYHLCLKFPTKSGIKTVWGNQKESRVCFIAEHKFRKLHISEESPTKRKKTKPSLAKEAPKEISEKETPKEVPATTQPIQEARTSQTHPKPSKDAPEQSQAQDMET
ncbi:uncharacterized protein LOC112084401 [Eutrema salsugineum]|uniref:uncharacterized protein LOC112084401 n=1 Tax=Eutrema salsugineum TaxID=72664 RepID=UPI000CED5B94|nr:uncharacterized protein LOC112084401 [Eutrema salsugineum]